MPAFFSELGRHCEGPGKPVACNLGLLRLKNGLLYGIVACHFGLLGFPGIRDVKKQV